MKVNELAIISLVLAAFFWIPFINYLIIAPAAIYFGLKGLIEIRNAPDVYKGKIYAITGILTGVTIIVLSFYDLIWKVL